MIALIKVTTFLLITHSKPPLLTFLQYEDSHIIDLSVPF